jgi:hypothetical protein
MSNQQLTPIGTISAGAAGSFADWRRSEPRILCERPIPILRLAGDGEGAFIPGRLTDCSLHGLGLMSPQPIESGEQFLARLKLEKLTLLIYTVRYCIPMKADQFRVGAKFTAYTAASFQGDLGAVITALTGQER